jgi:hypothetical protein
MRGRRIRPTPTIHYVKHYLLDFGNALGTRACCSAITSTSDYHYEIDLKEWALSLVTLGLHRQPWEGRVDPDLPGVGLFSAAHFDPGRWKANTFAQLPLLYADRHDQFWGAKIAIRFTREQLAAAVDAGHYSDPRSRAYLVDTLVQRQRIVAAYWFARVNPDRRGPAQGRRAAVLHRPRDSLSPDRDADHVRGARVRGRWQAGDRAKAAGSLAARRRVSPRLRAGAGRTGLHDRDCRQFSRYARDLDPRRCGSNDEAATRDRSLSPLGCPSSSNPRA